MHQDDSKEKDEFILFFKIVLDKIPTGTEARNGVNSAPKRAATTFAFPSFFYGCRELERIHGLFTFLIFVYLCGCINELFNQNMAKKSK